MAPFALSHPPRPSPKPPASVELGRPPVHISLDGINAIWKVRADCPRSGWTVREWAVQSEVTGRYVSTDGGIEVVEADPHAAELVLQEHWRLGALLTLGGNEVPPSAQSTLRYAPMALPVLMQKRLRKLQHSRGLLAPTEARDE